MCECVWIMYRVCREQYLKKHMDNEMFQNTPKSEFGFTDWDYAIYMHIWKGNSL